MRYALVTGGAGFLGGLLIRRLLADGWGVASIDPRPILIEHARLETVRGDIRKHDDLRGLMDRHHYDAVFHVAAMLAPEKGPELLTSNIEGTRVVADFARYHGVEKFVYTSTNCLWGKGLGRPVREDDAPCPVDDYGRSKWEAEKLLADFKGDMEVTIFRCPTIVDEGRLGLLAILFEFIREGRKVWVVGDGRNRYQFVYAQDLIDAMLRAVEMSKPGTYGIGSDDVPTMAETYESVIARAGSGSKVTRLPKWPMRAAMGAAYRLGLSPLGPYHYRMIASDFEFDTTAVKRALGWRPTIGNAEMLWRAYRHYAALPVTNSKMGLIRLLKLMS